MIEKDRCNFDLLFRSRVGDRSSRLFSFFSRDDLSLISLSLSLFERAKERGRRATEGGGGGAQDMYVKVRDKRRDVPKGDVP